MPRSHGLRDDDLMGRLAEIETRLDALDSGGDAPTGRTTDPARVPERDERRDTEARNRQVHVAEEGREPTNPAGMPDDKGGEMTPDNTRTVDASARDAAERRAARQAAENESKTPAKKDAPKKE